MSQIVDLILKNKETGEAHASENVNYIGGGTNFRDRIGLKYKGQVGQPPYNIPNSIYDLMAFIHDLGWYSSMNVKQTYDDDYLWWDRMFITDFKDEPNKFFRFIEKSVKKKTFKSLIPENTIENFTAESKPSRFARLAIWLQREIHFGGYKDITRMQDIAEGRTSHEVLSKAEKPINYDYVKNVYENMFRYLSEVGYYDKDGYFTFSGYVNKDRATEYYNEMLKSFNEYQDWVNRSPNIPKKSKELPKPLDYVTKQELFIKPVSNIMNLDRNNEKDKNKILEYNTIMSAQRALGSMGKSGKQPAPSGGKSGKQGGKSGKQPPPSGGKSGKKPEPKPKTLQDVEDVINENIFSQVRYDVAKEYYIKLSRKEKDAFLRQILNKVPNLEIDKLEDEFLEGIDAGVFEPEIELPELEDDPATEPPATEPPAIQPKIKAEDEVISYFDNEFLQNRGSREDIKRMIDQGGKNAQERQKIKQKLIKHINKKFGQQIKLGIGKDKFDAELNKIAYLQELDKVVSPQEYQQAGIEYAKFLNEKESDLTGVNFERDLQGLLGGKSLQELGAERGTASFNKLKKIKALYDSRLRLLGEPVIQEVNKAGILSAIEKINADKDEYNRLVDLTKQDRLIRPQMVQQAVEVEEELGEEGIPAPEQVQLRKAHEYTKKYLDVDETTKEVIFNPPKIDEVTDIHEARDAVRAILNEYAVAWKFGEHVDRVKNEKSFRENTPIGRRNMIIDAMGELQFTPEDLSEAIKYDPNFVKFLEGALGLEETQEPKPEDLDRVMRALQDVSEEQQEDFVFWVNQYLETDLPEAREQYGPSLLQEVNAPADVRVLPEGVTIRRAEDELQTDLARIDEISKRLDEIQTQKIGAVGMGQQALLTEERRLTEELKEKKRTAKDDLNARAKRQGQVSSASKRIGDLRPHLKNPTEQAIHNAISQTPEEQIQDFTNWYVFDIPTDQTGQGSKINNPLVKQNELRDEFILSGNIYNNFNQPYTIFDGVEERKDFFKEHSYLKKDRVQYGLQQEQIKSEEQKYLEQLNRGSNGLFSQDQTVKEKSNFKNIYQTPNDYFEGTLYPFQDTANTSIYVSEFEKNLNYFIEP